MMNINHNSTLADCLSSLANLGANSLAIFVTDQDNKPLAGVVVVKGIDEAVEMKRAVDAITDSWGEEHTVGSDVLIWHDASKELPDDDVRVLVADDNPESSELMFGHHSEGHWYFDDGSIALPNIPIIAWAHPPAKPAKKGGAE